MSKRHGATSVDQYRQLGYLPEAIVNFLALLGWSPPGEEEIFSLAELVQQFSMDRVAKNPAVFDLDKLNYINACYMKRLPLAELADLVHPHLVQAGYLAENLDAAGRAWLEQLAEALRDYISYAAEIVDHAAVFFEDAVEFENEEAHAVLRDADVPQVLEAFRSKLLALETVDAPAVKALLKSITKELKLGGKKVFMPVRVALTGCMHGPELIHLVPLIGRDRTLARLERMRAKI